MSTESGWCTIESDPAVFAELIEKFGATGLDVAEIWDLDAESIKAQLSEQLPVYGFIFLFKWTSNGQKAERQFVKDPSSIFFARQIVNNACATQAILSILLNLPGDFDIGATLSSLKEFTRDFDPEMKGMAIGEHELIREVHNSFARPEALYIDEDEKDKNDSGGADPFHFVSILPIDGSVVELDGLQSSPILVGNCSPSKSDFVDSAISHVKSRIAEMGSEIRFNLLAITRDPCIVLAEKLSNLPADEEWAREELELKLEAERRKKEDRMKENQLRKHNFIPLIMSILDLMAKKGKLKL